MFTGQAVDLRKKMLEISSRIRGIVDLNTQSKMCPEAYENIDTRNLIEPPARSLGGIAIALVGLVLVLLAANYVMYASNTKHLKKDLDQILTARPAQDVSTGQAAVPAASSPVGP
jgi:hypothetical protein